MSRTDDASQESKIKTWCVSSAAPQENAINNSTTSKNTDAWMKNVQINAEKYAKKHGHYPAQALDTPQDRVIEILKQLKKK